MESNPYAPPKAALSETAAAATTLNEPAFYPTTVLKLIVLSVCTMGLYEIYWFYRNWQRVKEGTGADISPFWRALFGFFFAYRLFDRVRKHPAMGEHSLPAGLLTAAWVLLTILWRLPDPYWLLTYLAVFALVPVQRATARINAQIAPDHDRNARFTVWNWVGVCLGGLCFLFLVYATFVQVPAS